MRKSLPIIQSNNKSENKYYYTNLKNHVKDEYVVDEAIKKIPNTRINKIHNVNNIITSLILK